MYKREIKEYEQEIIEQVRQKRRQLNRSKQLAKQLQGKLTQVLSQQIKTQSSISKLNKQQKVMKINFIKMYNHRKSKIQSEKNDNSINLNITQHRSFLTRMVHSQRQDRKLISKSQTEAIQQINHMLSQDNRIIKLRNKIKQEEIMQSQYKADQNSHDHIRKMHELQKNQKEQIEKLKVMTGRLIYQTKLKKEMDLVNHLEDISMKALSHNDSGLMKDLRDTFQLTKVTHQK